MKTGGFEICSITKNEFVVCPTQIIILDCNASPNPFTEVLLNCLLAYPDATLVDYIAVDEIAETVKCESVNDTAQCEDKSDSFVEFSKRYHDIRYILGKFIINFL
jgi:hypothetical protein